MAHIEDLFDALKGRETFTQLDTSHVYQQLRLEEEEETQQLLTIKTYRHL